LYLNIDFKSDEISAHAENVLSVDSGDCLPTLIN
jgi:hypothetical protein